MSYRHIISSGCIYAFVLLFTYAAVSKLLDFETFTVQLAQSPLLSAYAGVIAWVVPGVELGLSGLLLLERFRVPALYACFTLMVMFTAYIVIILHFSDFVPCSCGGVLEQLSWNQHLVFNVFFIVLAGVTLWLSSTTAPLKLLVLLLSLTIMGTAVVALLFVFSEKKMHRNNAFIRRYLPHPIKKIHQYDLKYSSYYIAGVGNGKIYLGNTTAPLLMTVLDSSLTDTTTTMIHLDQMELPYRAVKIHVTPPKFYVTDGTVPIILQGDTKDWKATTKMKGDYYFNTSTPIDYNNIAVRSNSSSTGESILGIIGLQDTIQANFSTNILVKQQDGIFDTDGMLIYNPTVNKLIYTYYYRNEYIVTDTELTINTIGETIDTVTKAQMHIAQNRDNSIKKLGGKTLLVNKTSATYKDLLFLESPRLGKHEPNDMLSEASIIDVYDFVDNSYRFSFYLYHFKHSKLRTFTVKNNILYALQGNYIVAYKLEKKHFE